MTAPGTTPNTPAIGLVFDINPADPAVVAVLVGVATLLLVAAAVCFRNGKSQRRTGDGGVGQEEEEEEQQQRQHEGQVSVCCSVPTLCVGG